MWTAIGLGAAALAGGAMGADAAKDASGQQADATNRGIALTGRQFDQTRADNAPFMRTGTAANQRLAQLLGIAQGPADENDPRFTAIKNELIAAEDAAHKQQYGMSIFDPRAGLQAPGEKGNFDQRIRDAAVQRYTEQYGNTSADTPGFGSLLSKFSASDLEADPVYKSGLEFGATEGRNAINARAMQAGGYDSGATLKALTRFGNDYGSTKANESYNRFTNDQNNIFNRLSGVSGTGQVATGQVASSGANAANSMSNLLTDAGNARAAGIVGGANAWAGGLQGAANSYNNYDNNQFLRKLLAGNSGGNPNANYGGQNLGQADYSAGYY